MDRFCVDCWYYRPSVGIFGAYVPQRCLKSDGKRDLVSGMLIALHDNPREARLNIDTNPKWCGESGQHWKTKDGNSNTQGSTTGTESSGPVVLGTP